MRQTPGLRRQIIQSLAVMTLGIIFLSVFGSYVFYAIAVAYLPGSISETWMPSQMEMLWIVCTIIAALGIALFVAIRLSRRILTPLNSVAYSYAKSPKASSTRVREWTNMRWGRRRNW